MFLQIIAHKIEGGCKGTSDVGIFSGITDAADVSVSLSDVGLGRGISRGGGWIGITLVLQHAYAGATSVDGVGVKFDAEAMRGVAEVPSLAV